MTARTLLKKKKNGLNDAHVQGATRQLTKITRILDLSYVELVHELIQCGVRTRMEKLLRADNPIIEWHARFTESENLGHRGGNGRPRTIEKQWSK